MCAAAQTSRTIAVGHCGHALGLKASNANRFTIVRPPLLVPTSLACVLCIQRLCIETV
jgi:hypothetical protein